MVAAAKEPVGRSSPGTTRTLTNQRAGHQKAVGDMIRANPGIDAIWGCCDFAPTGAIPAIRSSGQERQDLRPARNPLVDLERQGWPRRARGIRVPEGRHHRDGRARGLLRDEESDREADAEQFAYKQKIVDKANAGKGYPYPTAPMLAPVQEEVGEALHPAGLVSHGVRWGWRRPAPTGAFQQGDSPE